MIKFIPFQRMNTRISSSKEDSDLAFFYDLLLYGEFLTKTISLFLVASICEDKNRSRYRQEYNLVRANAIGDFSKSINNILTGPESQILCSSIREKEQKELTYRSNGNDWQYKSQKLLLECFNIFEIKYDKLPIKSPLRNWFVNFTILRNKTKGHGAPRIIPCSKASLKLEEAINLIVDNFAAFKRPWAYLHKNLSGKYRVSYLTTNSSEFDFLKRDNFYNLENGIYTYLDNPTKINLLYSTPELIDFHITNGNFRKNTFETISYLSDIREEKNASNYMQPIERLPNSHTAGLNEINLIGNCFTNLPLQTDEYINRDKLEKELFTILKQEDRFPIVTLVGRGGIGKTSLAINVIKDILQKSRFNIIIWFSARDIDLLLEGPKQVQTKIVNQKDISQEYCSLVHYGEKIKDKIQFFSNQLTKSSFGKALFVFDNFETVTNPIEIYEWLNTYIRNPNKILITSRISRNFKADYPIEIQGMTDKECNELIDLMALKLNIKPLLTDEFINNLIVESDGHPYIIKILLGEVAKNLKLIKIERIIADQEKILNALFKRTFQTLSPAAKRTFLTLCSWNSMIPSIALESVLSRKENEKMDVFGAIEELRQSSFIDVFNEGIHSFINVPLAAFIFGKTELGVYFEKLKILDDRKLLMEFGVTTSYNIDTGVFPRIEKKFKEVARRISNINDFYKELSQLEYLASKFPRAYLFIADIFEEHNDFDKVKEYIREYLKFASSIKDKLTYWVKLSNICQFTNDWQGENHALFELALIENVSFQILSNSANRVNNYFRYHTTKKIINDTKILLNKLIEIMKKRILEGNATDYSRLAWLMINNNDEKNAKILIKKGLKIDPKNEHCRKLYEKIN